MHTTYSRLLNYFLFRYLSTNKFLNSLRQVLQCLDLGNFPTKRLSCCRWKEMSNTYFVIFNIILSRSREQHHYRLFRMTSGTGERYIFTCLNIMNCFPTGKSRNPKRPLVMNSFTQKNCMNLVFIQTRGTNRTYSDECHFKFQAGCS